MKFPHFNKKAAITCYMLLLGIVICLLGGYVYAHINRHSENKEISRLPLAVSTAKAAMINANSSIKLTGTVEGITSAIISSPYFAQLESINVENGQIVNAGQTLFTTDTKELENNVRIAENSLNKASVNRDNIVTDYKRSKMLYDEGAIAKQSLDKAIVEQATSQTEVDDAITNLEIAKKRLSDATVVSPVTGVVANKSANIGQMVSAGSQLMTVEQIDFVYVTVQVEQQDIAKIQIGTPAAITVDAYPDKTFRGNVAVINPVARKLNRLFEVKIKVKNSEYQLKPGMFADVTINFPDTHAVLAIPRTALSSRKGIDYVFVVIGENQAKRIRIEKGDLIADKLSVLSGLNEGDVIIVDNLDKIKDGDSIMSKNLKNY